MDHLVLLLLGGAGGGEEREKENLWDGDVSSAETIQVDCQQVGVLANL